MKREHRLEEEHADIEYQIRVLMSKAETLRTDDEKLSEERLIQVTEKWPMDDYFTKYVIDQPFR
jgi:hypothetical protein